jgi:hypothetical protein
MSNIIIKRNIKSLRSSLAANLNYIDFNYKGPVDGDASKFVLHNGNAIINAYRMWLISDKNDYCRRPGFGGFLENNLNRYPFTPDSEEAINDELKSKTAEAFQYIKIIDSSVKCDVNHKAWIIKVKVQDTITGLIGDMYENGIAVPVV